MGNCQIKPEALHLNTAITYGTINNSYGVTDPKSKTLNFRLLPPINFSSAFAFFVRGDLHILPTHSGPI